MLTLLLLHWAVLVTPGANVLLVMHLAANGARTAALYAALGITSVAVIWSVLALYGVQAIFDAHAALRPALQALGGIYLVYLAIRLWRSAFRGSVRRLPSASRLAAFGLGFMTNILNPKSALFFGSVFATALAPSSGLRSMAAVAAMVFCNALVWHVTLALAFSRPSIQRNYARHATAMNRGAGLLVGLFGTRMVLGVAADLIGAARGR
jgi:threonine efflux protein